jgi:hypothetical protein
LTTGSLAGRRCLCSRAASSGGEKPFTVSDAVAVLPFTRSARDRPHPAESLKRLEILHTTIRGVCPSRFAAQRAVPFNFMRRRRLISTGALLSDSGLFELVASRLGSSAGLLLSGELRGRQHMAVWRCHGVTRSCTPAAAARHRALLVPTASARATRCRHAAWPSTSTAPCGPTPPPPACGGSFVLC